jgi:predicted DNA-binding transcriptional regulator AlpA
MDDILSEYLTLNEAAEALGLSTRTLVRWGQLRKGPPVTRIGRRSYYRKGSIREWLIEQEKP